MTLSSQEYWETRYASGGNSGSGSEGANAIWKATFLNSFVAEHGVRDVVEYGCGDGRQLELANYPEYTGLDVSATAIRMCEARFPQHTFHLLPIIWPLAAELVLSLDVIYHLTEQEVYLRHMQDVFGAATKWVILYTTDSDYLEYDYELAPHVRHWPVGAFVSKAFPTWELLETTVNPNPADGGCDFHLYGRA